MSVPTGQRAGVGLVADDLQQFRALGGVEMAGAALALVVGQAE